MSDILRMATISDDGLYRYELTRRWDITKPSLVWILLNPSVANEEIDDPTTRRCMGYARREGFGGVTLINLFALRATRPVHLLDHPDPEGPQNAETWRRILRYGAPAVAGWGANADNPSLPVSRALATADQSEWFCLGHTKSGQPLHPLYLDKDLPLVPL